MTCPNTEKQFKDFNVCDNVGGIYVITIAVMSMVWKLHEHLSLSIKSFENTWILYQYRYWP